MKLTSGTRLGPYEIISPLGAGAMGQVWLAQDTRLGRRVAVKTLPAEFARSVERAQRFKQEAMAVSALNHPHIVTIHDIGETEECRFIVMELVKGRTLREMIGIPYEIDQFIRLGRQIAKALAAMHAADITHRDIKPENVMAREDGYVKVLDFGIALLSPDTPGREGLTLFATTPGAVLGTAAYMSPEQARGESVSHPSDIFSLGLVFYELLTGRRPFEADGLRAMLDAIILQTVLSPSRHNQEIPAPLEDLIMRMLEKDAQSRPTAVEVDAALAEMERWRDGGTEEQRDRDSIDPSVPLSLRPPISPYLRQSIVGREKEKGELRECFAGVASGRGFMVCVSGEPGFGKTALVEDFLNDLRAEAQCVIARGNCSERLAGTEAFLPLLEVLDNLTSSGAAPARMLKTLAPTWHARQAPHAADDHDSARLLAEAGALSQERVKRELGNFLQEVSRSRPLVLFINDLHWADLSTIDVLAYLASRFDALRVLIVATFRPSDVALAKHPFLPVKQELESHGRCRELRLELLDRAEIDCFLAIEFPGHQLSTGLSELIHGKTEGNPLFMSDLARDLRDRGVIAQSGGAWTLTRSIDEIEADMPASVRALIERKIERLSEADRQALAAASVQGCEFDSAVLARALSLDSEDVEERLAALEREHHLVQAIREGRFPGGALTQRYRFIHLIYQNTLYAGLLPTRRSQLCAAVAEALENLHGENRDAAASEIAALWESAKDYPRAAEYFLRAARNASRLIAHAEAVALAERGLAALEKSPESSERARQEINLQLTLGLSLATRLSWAAAEVEEVFSRARELCEETGAAAALLTALRGLCTHHLLRANLASARSLAERFLTMTRDSREAIAPLAASNALGMTLWAMGEPDEAQKHFERALVLYSPEQHRNTMAMSNEDLGALSRRMSSVCLWGLGYPDRALSLAYESVALAHQLSHPFTQGGAHYAAAHLHLFRREWGPCLDHANAVIKLAEEHDMGDNLIYATIARDAAAAYQGNPVEGIAQMRQSIEAYRAKGSNLMMTCYLGLVADLYGMEWQVAEGLRVVDEALATAGRTGERWWEAELHRTRGKLTIKQAIATTGALPSLDDQSPLALIEPSTLSETESCFHRAIEVARRQNAKSLELRAVTSLGRFWLLCGKKDEARAMIAEIFGWFTEGFDTADLKDAEALLDELQSQTALPQ